ncbi:Ubiquitin-conjugating enzyme [Gracilaria domingensis]|nr:Ubiquitin-conjugating enzyme [Gracilaria domingensis]
MDAHALEALRAWKPGEGTANISSCQSKPPVVVYDGSQGSSFTARALFEFPDGGRFYLLLSGSKDDGKNSKSEPLTAMIEDDLGLPDGFLIDVNTFLFSNFNDNTRNLSPSQIVHQVLSHASRIYDNNNSNAAAASTARAKTATAALRGVEPPFLQTMQTVRRKRPPPCAVKDPVFAPTRIATTTLMKQLSILQGMETRRDGFTAQPVADDLYRWNVMLYFDNVSDCEIAEDLKCLPDYDGIQLELRFPGDYPNVPPFVRVVSPYVVGGHVASHGGICMELLTTSGWAPVYSLDLVCIQIRAQLIHGNARIHRRSHKSYVHAYTYEGALSDHRNIVRVHRWHVHDPNRNKSKKQRS